MSTVSVHVSEGIATITLDRPRTLNSITAEGKLYSATRDNYFHSITTLDYDAFANALREIDAREEVLVTVWQGVSSAAEYTYNTNFLLKLEDQRLGIGFARTFNSHLMIQVLLLRSKIEAQMLNAPDQHLMILMRVRRAHCGTTSGLPLSVQQQTVAKR